MLHRIRFAGWLLALAAVALAPRAAAAQDEGQGKGKGFVKKGELSKQFDVTPYEMKAGKVYVLDVMSDDFDTGILLKGPDGNPAGFDDDGGEGLNSRLLYSPPKDGKFEVNVGAIDKKTGKYELSIQPVKAMTVKTGEVTADDPKDKVLDKPAKTIPLELKKGRKYVLLAFSQDFQGYDPYLRLEGPDGREVGKDDDGAGGLNSRLDFTPEEDGTYKAVVSAFRGQGPFALAVLAPSEAELKKLPGRAGGAPAEVNKPPMPDLVGKKAPDIAGEFTINGKAKKLSDLRGKVVLVDFWAVWCGPCIRTFPHLREWQEKYGDDGLEILGVTTYFERYGFDKEAKKLTRAENALSQKEENGMLRDFVGAYDLKHQILAVPREEWQNVGDAYGIEGIPTAVLVDRDGVIRMVRVGASDENAEQLEAEIRKLLDKKGGE